MVSPGSNILDRPGLHKSSLKKKKRKIILTENKFYNLLERITHMPPGSRAWSVWARKWERQDF